MSFSNSEFVPAQQGHLDGFCGVYACLNFFCRRFDVEPESKKGKALFRELLADLERQDRLTVHRICEGFLEGHLQKAFNRVAKANKLMVKARRFETFLKRFNAKAVFDGVAHLGDGEAAMLSMNKGCHWVLAFDCDGQTMRVDDSSFEPRSLVWQREESRSLGLSKKDGLVFLNA